MIIAIVRMIIAIIIVINNKIIIIIIIYYENTNCLVWFEWKNPEFSFKFQKLLSLTLMFGSLLNYSSTEVILIFFIFLSTLSFERFPSIKYEFIFNR